MKSEYTSVVIRYDLDDYAHDGYAVFPFPGIEDRSGPSALLTLKSSGSMKFMWDEKNDNRTAFFRLLGIEESRVVSVELLHSKQVVFCSGLGVEPGTGADGILVTDTALVPAVTVADCVPIWIYDRASGSYGVLHSGWRGTGIIENAVLELQRRFGTQTSSVSIVIGPSIGTCCYTVDEDRAEYFRHHFGDEMVRKSGTRKASIDLRGTNIHLAMRLGIGSIAFVDACTSCDIRLGSFRREGASGFTRMAAMVGHFGL
jgi:hypothetical protein